MSCSEDLYPMVLPVRHQNLAGAVDGYALQTLSHKVD